MKIRHVLFSAALAAMAVRGQVEVQLADDVKLRLGGDLRVRYEGFDAAVPNPDVPKAGRHTTEYFRIRTRVGGSLDFGEDLTLNLRLGNRVHSVTTSPNRQNNDGASTWEFPDEVYVDAANIVYRNLMDGRLSLTLGRQDLKLGNGMLYAEGTPFDQGRSVYSDGLTVRYEDETEKVTAFVLYDRWKDGIVFINDRNRALRSGDIFTAGLYWTHQVAEPLSIDVYYMYNNLDDKHPETAERAHEADASVNLHTAGLRLFGRPVTLLDYSVEAAQQFGRDEDGSRLAGSMADARLNFHLNDDCTFKPVLGVELTHLSGDDREGDRNRGWNPLMSQCPLWGEELLPIMFNGMWSNLNMVGTHFSCKITDACTLKLYATDYQADDRDGLVGANANTGGGRHVGLLAGVMTAYKFTSNLSAQAWWSHFMPGDFYGNGHDCNWFRLELTASF
jgi:hypothetical protein